MCGIAGYFAYADAAIAPTHETLRTVRDAMVARGPDGEGLWFTRDDRVGFGHRRLSIIDTSSGGHQPMHLAEHGLTIVFNGEIYNYRELRVALEARGCRFRTQSDTEVLLHLYAVHGEGMLRMLRGMFAFALWDARAGELLLARDPYGIKPLYLSDQDGCLRFASQVRALLCDPAVSRAPSPAGLAGFHLFGSVPEPYTAFAAIRAFPPGATIRISAKGAQSPKYFASIPAAIAAAGGRPASDAERLLRDSVRAHLVADVEVGAFLSGGVDSGAIVGLMRDCGKADITACTLGFEEFEGTENDEVTRARSIASHYGVKHHIRYVGAQEFTDDLPAIFAAMDQPSVDGFNTWFISKACRELGLKVALSGLGGDELMHGYSTFQTIPRTFAMAGPLARNKPFGPFARALLRRMGPVLLRRNPKLAGLLDHAGSFAGSYLLRRAVLLPFELDRVMDPAMAKAGLAELEIERAIAQAMNPAPPSEASQVAALESALYMRNQLLRDADWAGMAHSLEIRVPWVDYRLLLDMAGVMIDAAGKGKALLAGSPRSPLPPAILGHRKTGFMTPVSAWMAPGHNRPTRVDSRRMITQVLESYTATMTV